MTKLYFSFDKAYAYDSFEHCGEIWRGPRPDFDKPFLAAIGAAQTFGRFAAEPWPKLLGDALGKPVWNMGIGGASPDFFQNSTLLKEVNRASTVILQVMSCRGVSLPPHYEKVAPTVGGQFVRWLKTGELIEFEEAWRRLVEQGADVVSLITQMRQKYMDDFVRLCSSIRVPMAGLYFCSRIPETLDEDTQFPDPTAEVDVHGARFPHFVTKQMLQEMTEMVDVMFACVSSAGLPQTLPVPVKYQVLGKQVVIEKNHYYPSPEMHRQVAAMLSGPLAGWHRPRYAAFWQHVLPIYVRDRIRQERLIQMPRPTTSFLIASAPRVGTHLLRTALDEHSEITAFGEVFNPDVYQLPQEPPITTDLKGWLTHSYTVATGVTVLRMDKTHPQTSKYPRLWQDLPHALPTIWLYRRNMFDRYVSTQVAASTRVYSSLPNEEVPTVQPIALDRLEVTRAFLEWEQQDLLRKLFINVLDMSYEDLVADFDGQIRKAQEFLGVHVESVRPRIVKQMQVSVRSLVVNYAEIAKEFRGTRFERHFEYD